MPEHSDDPELLISFSMRFPNMHRDALASLLAPIVQQMIAAGGAGLHFGIQTYDPDEDNIV